MVVAAQNVLFAAALSAVPFALLGCVEECTVFIDTEPVGTPVYECGAACNKYTAWCKGEECAKCINTDTLGNGVCGKDEEAPTPPPSTIRQQCTFKVSKDCCSELASGSPFTDSINTSSAPSCSDNDLDGIASKECKEVPVEGACGGNDADVQQYTTNCHEEFQTSGLCATLTGYNEQCIRDAFAAYSDSCKESLVDWQKCNLHAGHSKCISQCCALSCLDSDECFKCGEEAGIAAGCEQQYMTATGLPGCRSESRLYASFPSIAQSYPSFAAGALAASVGLAVLGLVLFRRAGRQQSQTSSPEE